MLQEAQAGFSSLKDSPQTQHVGHPLAPVTLIRLKRHKEKDLLVPNPTSKSPPPVPPVPSTQRGFGCLPAVERQPQIRSRYGVRFFCWAFPHVRYALFPELSASAVATSWMPRCLFRKIILIVPLVICLKGNHFLHTALHRREDKEFGPVKELRPP